MRRHVREYYEDQGVFRLGTFNLRSVLFASLFTKLVIPVLSSAPIQDLNKSADCDYRKNRIEEYLEDPHSTHRRTTFRGECTHSHPGIILACFPRDHLVPIQSRPERGQLVREREVRDRVLSALL